MGRGRYMELSLGLLYCKEDRVVGTEPLETVEQMERALAVLTADGAEPVRAGG